MEEKLAFSIPEVRRILDLGIGTYHNLKTCGNQPKEMKVGRRVLISVEAAAEWRREQERLTVQREACQRELMDVDEHGQHRPRAVL